MMLDFSDELRLPSGDGPPLRIDIRGDIDRKLLALVAAGLEDHPDAALLDIQIDSPGGHFGAAYDLYVVLRRHRAARKTARIRRAESGALLVAMAADERIADVGAPFLLHAAAQSPDGRWTAAQHLEAAADLEWIDSNMAAMFAYRTGCPIGVFVAAMADEEHAPLDWCLRHGIITKIKELQCRKN